jgi:hypothetical protein
MGGDPVPWVGLLALVAMFAIPFLPDRIFEGRGRSGTGRAATSAVRAARTGSAGMCARAANQEPVLSPRQRRSEAADQEPALPARPGRLTAELRRLDR